MGILVHAINQVSTVLAHVTNYAAQYTWYMPICKSKMVASRHLDRLLFCYGNSFGSGGD